DNGLRDSTIKRWLGVVWTAMNTAASCEQLDKDKIPKRIERRLWGERTADQPIKNRSSMPCKRALELQEWAALFNAAAGWQHRIRYLILQIATGGRTAAVVRLTRAQVDFRHGTIDLNPPGREQTNKYNPTIPACETVLRHLKLW